MMYSSLVLLSSVLGASALSIPRSTCDFTLTASGGEAGTIGSLGDGQTRIGGGLAATTFSISSGNGTVTDSAGRACILTRTSTNVDQFQCDLNGVPTSGFGISSNGSFTASGSSVWYACPASDTEWNLYTIPVVGQAKCVEVSLTASGCYSTNSSSSSSAVVASTSVVAATSAVVATSPAAEVSVVTVTVHDCEASSSLASLASSTPVVVASSAPAVVASSSVAVEATSGVVSSAVEASSTPVAVESTTAVVEASSTPVAVESTTAVVEVSSIPVAESATAVIVASSTPVAESATAVVVASSTPVVVESTTAVEASSSPAGVVTSVAVEASSTPVVVESTTPVAVASSTPVVEESSTPAVESTTTAVEVTSTPAVVESTTPVVVESSTPVVATTSTTPVIVGTVPTSSAVVESSTPVVVSTASVKTTEVTSAVVVPTTLVTSANTTPVISKSTVSWANVSTTATTTSAVVTTVIPSTTTTETASSTSASSTCVATTLTGTDTEGNYQYPHLIIPVSSVTPTTAAGTQYFGTISSNTSTIFNFDIPETYEGKTCNLIFLLPEKADLETSSYTFSGSGEIEFTQLSTAATEETDYDNQPSVAEDLGTFDITVGSSTLIQSVSCSAGDTVAYELSSVDDTYLYFFEDWNPSPLGLFITYC